MDKIKYGIILFSISFTIQAQDLSRFIKTKRLYIETERRVVTNREYYLRDRRDATYDVNLGLDLELPQTVYYNNKVTSITDSNQFRFIGLDFEVGMRPFEGIDVYFQHFSGHALDESYPEQFPQRNKIGIRWNLISN